MVDLRVEATRRFASAALNEVGGADAEAAVLLLDAAIAITLARFGKGADEMAGYLAEYLVQQVSHVTGAAGHG